MIIILGLVVLVAAVVVGVAGVLRNGGSTHPIAHDFTVFGYHVTGSTGTLFLFGIVVGAVGLGGLSLLLTGARRTARLGRQARRDLKQSRHDTASVSRDRDDLVEQRRRETADRNVDQAGDASPDGAHRTDRPTGGRGRRGLLGRRSGERAPVSASHSNASVTSERTPT